MGYPSDISADDAFPAVPSDSAILTNCTGVYVGGTGDLALVTLSGKSVLFKALPVGTTVRLKIKQILATGTTATLLVGLQ
jgi:hypothetical protein